LVLGVGFGGVDFGGDWAGGGVEEFMRKREKSSVGSDQSAVSSEELPLWVQWVLAGIALALGGWFGWMMF
jgi:hypothetical protein